MWPTFRDGLIAFFTDKVYFASKWDKWVAKVRALILGAGAALAFYGPQLEASLPPALVGKVRIAGILVMALALALRAGDKTPTEVKALAQEIRDTPKGFARWWVLPALVLLCLAVLAGVWTYKHRQLTDAQRAAEAATLALHGQLVAAEGSKSDLQAEVLRLLESYDDLAKRYAEAKAAAPGSHPTGAADLSTGSIKAHGKARLAGTPLPGQGAAAAPAISDPPPAPGGHSGEGAPAQGALVFDQSTFAPGCLLAEGDKSEIRVHLITLETRKDNTLLVGSAEVWRLDPPPQAAVVGGSFTASLSTATGLAPAPEPRWGFAAAGSCGRGGCAPGVALLLPPFHLPFVSARAEAALVALTGPIEPHIVGFVGLRY
jgi:hypothetical protein